MMEHHKKREVGMGGILFSCRNFPANVSHDAQVELAGVAGRGTGRIEEKTRTLLARSKTI